jgi:predicted CoA-substrate-specific enzyme activase
MYTAGIDIGSISTKAVIMEEGRVLASRVIFTGYNAEAAGRKAFEMVLADTNLAPPDIRRIIATGYGRKSVSFADKAVTEIMCHAAGARFLNPEIRSVIDIGGQDSKAILLDETGRVVNFAMNDKCAAGTGRFLEVMARALEVDLDEFGQLSLQAEAPSKISSLCTVFAESEVVSLIARGEKRENIIAGIHESICVRVLAMANRVGVRGPVAMTGGVAKNIGVVRAFEKVIAAPVEVSPYAQVNGAIGAALLAQNLDFASSGVKNHSPSSPIRGQDDPI